MSGQGLQTADFMALGIAREKAQECEWVARWHTPYDDRCRQLVAFRAGERANLEAARLEALERKNAETGAGIAALRAGEAFSVLGLLEAKEVISICDLALSRSESPADFYPTEPEKEAATTAERAKLQGEREKRQAAKDAQRQAEKEREDRWNAQIARKSGDS